MFRTRTFDAAGLDPLTGYSRLRHHVPGMPSFLLESRAQGEADGRYSIVGYRALGAEALPPGVDALTVFAESHGGGEAVASLAEALAQSAFGFFAYEVAHVRHGVRPVGEQVLGALALLRATIAIFDHREATITVAGRAGGKAVERCMWELTHGPEARAEPEVDPAREPDGFATLLDDQKFGAKVARAKSALFGELSELVLARGFVASRGRSDALEAYRALRAGSGSPFLYFFDVPDSPAMGGLKLFGSSEQALCRRRTGGADEGSIVDEVGERLPHPSLTGPAQLEAMRALRRIEDAPRELFGGAVGYVGPGGSARLVLSENAVVCCGDQYSFAVGVRVTTATVAAAASAQSVVNARSVLAALHHAQEVSKAGAPTEASPAETTAGTRER